MSSITYVSAMSRLPETLERDTTVVPDTATPELAGRRVKVTGFRTVESNIVEVWTAIPWSTRMRMRVKEIG